jgi:hypothetical protein
MTGDIDTFKACGHGIMPQFPCEELPIYDPMSDIHFNRNFSHWKKMRSWCEQQGWVLNEDFLANGKLHRPWYFADKQKQMLFTLRWS